MISWNSVKEKLPEIPCKVLIYYEVYGYNFYSVGEYVLESDGYKFLTYETGIGSIEHENVLYWAYVNTPEETIKNWALLFKDNKGSNCYMRVECSEPGILKNAKILEDSLELSYMNSYIEVKSCE